MNESIFGDSLDKILENLNDLDSEFADVIGDIQGEIETREKLNYITPEDAAPDLDEARTHVQDAAELVNTYIQENKE